MVELTVCREGIPKRQERLIILNSVKINGSYDQNAGDTNVLPLSASKIGGKIKPETQSHQLGPLISCGFEMIDF
jgi:hypothetical protein